LNSTGNHHIRCTSCGSSRFSSYDYDNHLGESLLANPRRMAKAVLPYFDHLIPEFLTRLKRVSRRGHGVPGSWRASISKNRLFKGQALVCLDCGHGVLHEPPSQAEIESYYRREYSSEKLENPTIDDYGLDPRATSQLQFVGQYLETRTLGNVLEIGAGRAFALQLLRDRYKNARVYVCEPSERFQRYYEKRNIFRVADFFPFETSIRFNYIHTSHWLEHVLDLESTIASLRKLLSQEGLLFIEVPNTRHPYWTLPYFDNPHIHFFTMHSLKNIFERFSFRCLDIGEFGNTFLDRWQGVRQTNSGFGLKKPNGRWLRALFEIK